MNQSSTTNLTAQKSWQTFWLIFTIAYGTGCVINIIPVCGWFLSIPLMIGGIVFYFILLYDFWALLKDYTKITSAGRAVGFSFIPFYNFYWMYVANVKLCEEFNEYIKFKNYNIQPVNTTFALVFYIITLSSIPLYIIFFPLGTIATVGAAVFQILFTKQLTDAALNIISVQNSNDNINSIDK